MQSKLFWTDTETSGVKYNSAIVQIAGIFEIDGVVDNEFSIRMRPHDGADINAKALEHNNLTKEEIMDYKDHKSQFNLFKEYLEEYVDPFDPQDKFVVCGYNVKFDCDMIRALFTRCGDKFYGSWFFWPVIDVQTLVAEHLAKTGLRLKNYQLSTICNHFGIEINAHEALSDIQATRELYYKLKG